MASQRIVIANTTPLINFAQIDRLGLLRELFGEVTVPPAVIAELQAKREIFPKASAAADSPLLRVVTPQNSAVASTLTYELHVGEAECLALSLEQPGNVLLVLDDMAARAVAQHHRRNFTGTVGCLCLAKERGLIPLVAPLLLEMRQEARFWLKDDFVQTLLISLGEGNWQP